MQPAEMLRVAILELWGRGRAELVEQLYAPDVVDHNPVPGQRPGHDGLRDVLAAFHTAFPDLTVDLHGTTGDAESAADWWTFRGTHTGPLFGLAPTGRRVAFGGMDAVRVRDGLITELWHVEDNAALLGQLGVTSLQMMDDRHTNT